MRKTITGKQTDGWKEERERGRKEEKKEGWREGDEEAEQKDRDRVGERKRIIN